MMSNWNGTILGPPHVRRKGRHETVLNHDANGRSLTERPRKSDLQREHSLRTRLSRQPSDVTIRIKGQCTLR